MGDKKTANERRKKGEVFREREIPRLSWALLVSRCANREMKQSVYCFNIARGDDKELIRALGTHGNAASGLGKRSLVAGREL